MWYEPYPHQKMCSIQILSYLLGFCTTWSISVQVFWAARVIHGSLAKRVQTWKTCLIPFNLLHYLCLICFSGMDWCARNNSFFIFLDKLKGTKYLSWLQEHIWNWIIVRQWKSVFRAIFKILHHSLNLEVLVPYWL